MLNVCGWERSQGELITVLDLSSLDFVKHQFKHTKIPVIAPFYDKGPGYCTKRNDTSTGKSWGRSGKSF